LGTNRYSAGILLIVIAFVLLLGKLGVFSFLGRMFWPLLILALAALLHLLYFSRSFPSGILIPAGILLTYSLMFLFCNWFGWGFMKYLWPGFIFGVAVGLYEYTLFERGAPRMMQSASWILALTAAVLFALMLLIHVSLYFIIIVLIVAGVVLVSQRSRIW